MLPKVLRLPSPAQISRVNAQLLEEVERHQLAVSNLQAEAAERRHLENKLRKNEARLKAILDTAAEGIVTINEKGIVETCNPAAAKMFGFAPNEMFGRKITELMPFPDNERHDDYIATYRKTGRTNVIGRGRVITAARRDGSHFPVDIAVGEFMDSDGHHFTGIMRDISDRVAAEMALKASEQRLELALMGADLGLWDWNVKTGDVVYNARWANMLGYSLDELDPSHAAWQSRIHPDDLSRVMAALNAHLDEKSPFYESEHRLRAKCGEWRWVLSRGKVFERDEHGRPLRAAGTDMDISDRKTLEERFLRQQAELLHVQRLSTAGELAATMAHELNQPLAAITNYIGGATLRFAPVLEAHPSLREIMEEALRLSQRAAEVIFGIRSLVRKHEIGRQWTDIAKVVDETLSLVRSELEKRNIGISVDIAPGLPSVWGQRVHLQQLVLNLIMNAMDAMDSTEIRHRELKLDVALSDTNEVVLTVCDTGIGIPPDLAQKIFEPFVSSKPNGIGLGLSICRTIAEAHGGRISAYTEPEQGGACFTFSLPVGRNDEVHHVVD